MLGCKNDLKTFAEICHRHGVVLVGDGAQSVPHIKVDVQDLGVDFLSFSGRKMLGSDGDRRSLRKERAVRSSSRHFSPAARMIESVTREGAVWAEVPHKFEAEPSNAGGAYAICSRRSAT